MKIYLINMPFCEQEYTKFSEKWDYIEDEYLGINIVRALLQKHNAEYHMSDKTSIKDMTEEIFLGNYDTVMISVMQTSARLTYEFIKKLRNDGYRGIIFIGGWFAKLSWRDIFENDWDVNYVCYADAENVLPDWLENPDASIAGIANKQNYQQQPNTSQIRNKNLWPKNYCSPLREPGRKTYRLETSRGCPHACCTFCSLSCANVIKDKWKPLPMETILSEIREIHQKFGVSRFSLTDDDMLGPIETAEARARDFCKAVKTLPFRIHFSGSVSVRAAVNENILDYLLDAGLEQLGIGFESADEDQLRRYNKQQSLEENFIAAKNITVRNINLIPGLITFDPFASAETIKKNLDFLFYNIHHYDLGKLTKKLYVITGTPIARLVKQHGLLTGDYLNYDYRFLHEETERLYRDFQEYTVMAKDVQLEINRRGLQFDHSLGIHHKNVAEKILETTEWTAYAENEIEQIKRKIGVLQL